MARMEAWQCCSCMLSYPLHQFPRSKSSTSPQEDQEAAGCVVFSRTYISLHKRSGQRLMILKDGERNGPSSTTRSGDDDDDDDDDNQVLTQT